MTTAISVFDGAASSAIMVALGVTILVLSFYGNR